MLPRGNSSKSRYSVCRVLNGCALVNVASFGRLGAAKNYMQRIAVRSPDSYLVFSKRSRRVLARYVGPAR